MTMLEYRDVVEVLVTQDKRAAPEAHCARQTEAALNATYYAQDAKDARVAAGAAGVDANSAHTARTMTHPIQPLP